LVSVAVGTCLGAAFAFGGWAGAAAPDDPRRLRDGFLVAPGSELVGPVFPRIAFANPAFRGWTGWTAVVDVVGDAATVFDEYVAQARQHGFDVEYSDRSCRQSEPGDVTCNGGATGVDTQFDMSLRVCTSCATPIATATIDLLSADDTPTFAGPLPGAPPEPGFALRLDTGAREKRRRALPEPGQTIPFLTGSYQGAGPKSPLTVAPGADAVVSAQVDCLDLGGMLAVLRSPRSVATVFDQYRLQIRRQANNGAPTSARKVVRGREVGAVNGSYANAAIVGARDGTWILVNECFAD
jgi:hypothetical protein